MSNKISASIVKSSVTALKAVSIIPSKFKTSTSGVAAVEFALILPVMLVLYIGAIEMTRVYAADRKAVVFAHTIADLATQAVVDNGTVSGVVTGPNNSGFQSLADADIQVIFGLSSAVLYPFNPVGANMRLTMLAFDSTASLTSTSNGFVDWEDVCTVDADGISCAAVSLITPNNRCDVLSVPPGFAAKNGYTMLSEVDFKYNPIVGGIFPFMPTAGIALTEKLYMQPRGGTLVVRTRISGVTPARPATTAIPTNVAVACAGAGFVP